MNILIVDDSKMNIRIAEDALKEFNVIGEILSCQSGEEAIEFVEKQPVDLILLDIVMPGITGVDFLMLARERGYLNDVKIIMLTTVDDIEILKQCFELGASDYIHKPFNKVEFVVRVKAALKEAENEKKLMKALELFEKQNIELKRINQTLKETQSYVIAKEKMTAIGSLLYGLTQEIGIPLSNLEDMLVLRTNASEKRESLEAHSEPEKWERIRSEIRRIRKIITSLEELSSENKQEKFTYVKMSDLVDEILIILASELKKVSVITKNYQDDSKIYCNVNSFKQALIHVFVNAIYAIREVEQSEISIRTLELEDTIILIIEDNGEGLTNTARSNAFDPFFTTKPRQQFMGLGLSMVYDIIVKNHGGNVEVDSFDGKTCVSITMNKNLRTSKFES